MSTITGFKSNGGTPFAYLQDSNNASVAIGLDSAASDVFKISVSTAVNALPSTSPQIIIDPTANGNMTFTPNGTGEVIVSYMTAGVVQSSSSGVLASSNGSNGQILIGGGTAPAWANITSTGGTVIITNGANTINLESSGATASSFPTDSGTATPSAGALTIHGANGITTSGSGSTVTVNLTNPVTVPHGGTGAVTLTAHSLLLGEGTSAVAALGAATNGQLPIGSTGSDPVLGTISGGTGITVTNGAGTISIAASATGVVQTLTGNSGGAISPTAGNINIVTANTNVTFVGSGSTETLNFNPSSNLALGTSLPSLSSGTNNAVFGSGAGAAISSGSSNTFIGGAAGAVCSSGANNCAFGYEALNAMTNANQNCAFGTVAGLHCTGSANLFMGFAAGELVTSGASNMFLGSQAGQLLLLVPIMWVPDP